MKNDFAAFNLKIPEKGNRKGFAEVSEFLISGNPENTLQEILDWLYSWSPRKKDLTVSAGEGRIFLSMFVSIQESEHEYEQRLKDTLEFLNNASDVEKESFILLHNMVKL